MFAIEVLPAQQGDALFVEYGPRDHLHRFLVDAGTPPTAKVVKARIEALPTTERDFELLVITHIDTDHIGGVLRLLSDPDWEGRFGDVWFNAWRHLTAAADQPLGPIDGEILDQLLEAGSGGRTPAWNAAFDGRAIQDDGPPPTRTLPGGMQLTVLAPGRPQLKRLRRAWASVIRDTQISDAEREALVAKGAAKRGIDLPLGAQVDVALEAGRPFDQDDTPANGSSVVLLAEFEGRSALLTGDGFPSVIESGVRRLLDARGGGDRLRVDALKLPHHGSRNNTSMELVELIDARHVLVSSSGAIFNHPDPDAIARVLVAGGGTTELAFNYRTDRTSIWDDPVLQAAPDTGYRAAYGVAGSGFRVEL
jgi:beta-lactamase superfamily II metal-dependent hydrolase